MKNRLVLFLTLILTLAVSVFGLVACGSDGKEEPEKAEGQELSYELNSEETGYVVEGIGTFNGTALVIPSTYNGLPVIGIGRRAFNNNASLTSVSMPDGLTTIDVDAFSGCRGLTALNIPDSVTKIDLRAFNNCAGLVSVTIGGGITTISADSFSNCTSLNSITIPDNVIDIGTRAFKGCTNLENVVIGDGVTTIDVDAFSGCGNIRSVILGEKVNTIEIRAFDRCNLLSKVYYVGTAASWETITIDSDNTLLTDATRYYYSETSPSEEGNYWCYVNGEVAEWK